MHRAGRTGGGDSRRPKDRIGRNQTGNREPALPDDATRQRDRVNDTKTMAKQAITLKIAGKSYPFTIESGKEEMYRLAEREVNNYLALIKQQNIRNWTDMDYLSMTALKFAIAEIGMRQSRELGGEDLQRLEALDSEIEACLNDPKL